MNEMSIYDTNERRNERTNVRLPAEYNYSLTELTQEERDVVMSNILSGSLNRLVKSKQLTGEEALDIAFPYLGTEEI